MYSEKYIYCLEGVADVEATQPTFVLPALETLAFDYGITNVYKTCDTIEGFEESISTLLYEDRNFNSYAILYFVFEGKNNTIILDDYYYSLEEIAECFEGKLTGKIIHFANTMCLDLEEDTAQYFLDVTGAKAISGYGNRMPMQSTVLDNLYFALCQEHDEVVDLVEALFEKQQLVATSLGFTLYY